MVCVALPLVVAGGMLVRYNWNENASRRVLATELDVLGTPPNCQEQKRDYQKGSIDVNSSWIVTYACQTTAGEAYDTIMEKLRQRNYFFSGTGTASHTNEIPPLDYLASNYGFSADFTVNYNFHSASSEPRRDEATLRTIAIYQITVQIERAYDGVSGR